MVLAWVNSSVTGVVGASNVNSNCWDGFDCFGKYWLSSGVACLVV